MATTIKDIANKLGIATSTVSKGLNGANDISSELRQLVLDTAIEMGYTTKKMKKESHQKLCILIENMDYLTPDSFGYEIVLGFKQMAISEKWDVDVVQINSAIQSQNKYDTYMLKNGYSGAFFVGFEMHDDWILQLADTTVPSVLLDNYIKTNALVGSVSTDSFEGIDLAVNHLASLGHTKIAFLNGSPNSTVSDERYRAFINSMEKHQLSIDEDLIEFGHYMSDCAKHHIPKFLEKRATSIICASDTIASGAISECQLHNLSIPEDISIIGFDDLPFAAELSPSLTTIRQDRLGLGKCAYSTLSGLLKNVYISNTTMRAKLIIRNSTGTAKK